MDVFRLRNQLTEDYAAYAGSFIEIRDPHIRSTVEAHLQAGVLWPEPLIQLNPSFQSGGTVDELVEEGVLHPECGRIFRKGKEQGEDRPLQFHQHQADAIRVAREGHNYILMTGTGSGKSLAYIVPIVDHVLRRGSGQGIQAIIVYPMNALANSQMGELEKFLIAGYGEGHQPVTFKRYTGQESEDERQKIIAQPPDILLTNYVMLELMMTRPRERRLMDSARGLRFLVLDELHTYRGRQGADVALLVRRVRDRLEAGQKLQYVGTSATLASEGSYDEQRTRVATVGTQLFGSPVQPEHIIGETLQRATPEPELSNPAYVDALRQAARGGKDLQAPKDYRAFVQHPLSSWIESTFGVQMRDGRLARSYPRTVRGEHGAANALAALTGVGEDTCGEVIEKWLLSGYNADPDPRTGFPPFAFRLHQFLSPGDTVYASIEPEESRYLTLSGQHFVPGNREQVLFPLCFCRECGQEYYTVRLTTDDPPRKVRPRDFSDRLDDADSEAGYLYLSTTTPWPDDLEGIINRLPDDWLEERDGVPRIRSHRRKQLPRQIRVIPDGGETADGQTCVFIPMPFMFCLHCGVAYGARQGEFGKLASLSSEGRSSATTVLSLSAIRSLRQSDLKPHAQKLLSFTDNRQDASLQAGHFNDFVEVGLLRGAIYQAAVTAGAAGLRHETIAQQVFDALGLPLYLYASDPNIRFQALQETQKALRDVLGYRIYRDLRRGWRVTSPNLEQSGLLEITYESLAEVCAAEDVWESAHPALALARPETRERIAKVLLDFLRRELAIKVSYLDPGYQERIQQASSQRLIEPWAIDEDERLEYASIAYPRPAGGDDSKTNVYLSGRGGFGIFLRRPSTFPEYDAKAFGPLNLAATETVIRDIFEGLRVAGLVEIVDPATNGEVPGYQLVASAMRWCAGEGTRAFHDPIRVPSEADGGNRPNPFFVDFYRQVASTLVGYRAKEHTAQVPSEDRIKREEDFRHGNLPILYCSPTMELGVDIAELNVVNLRNVPPTPANYAQRSGRAGRSGQPALVFTYCSSGSPHDQYFFKRPDRMVMGAVAPPRLDLTNVDLLRAHIHAIWLAESGISLGDTLKELLDVDGDDPSLALLPGVREQAEQLTTRAAARERARRVLATIADLEAPDALLETTLQNIVQSFDHTCDRWRTLYRSALKQADVQGRIIRDASRPKQDKDVASRLRRDAEAQLRLLTEIDSLAQSDFYSYRYFATEGFLPGYSFPRLPISAFIPARRTKQRDEFLSRPRFLAISEFGPRAVVYHEGSRYLINQIIMPVQGDDSDEPLTTQIKQCGHCGYVHPLRGEAEKDICERCRHPLDPPFAQPLLRLQNVVTRRRDRISSDEEERLRLGYEIRTGVRFSAGDQGLAVQTAQVNVGETELARLTFAQAATLWRINLGWARRKERDLYGFVLDIEHGYWARNEQNEDDPTDPMSARTRRVIPYVEDSRNCLLLEPNEPLASEVMASLQAALKRAIEARYQLEDNELAAEPLPDSDNRRLLLFYEAAEGGAGVLRQLVDDPLALADVAREALRICHFDPDEIDPDTELPRDRRHAEGTQEDCEAACYQCLLSYANQREHAILDRQEIVGVLATLAGAQVASSPTADTRADHLARLVRLSDSELEREWLYYLNDNGYRLPDSAQTLFDGCGTRPDFVYDHQDAHAVIYIDGPHHDDAHRQQRDVTQTDCMEDDGFVVLRFGYRDDWAAVLARYPHIFGGKA